MLARTLALLMSTVALAACGASSKTASGAPAGRHLGLVLRPAPVAEGCSAPRALPDRRAPAAVRKTLGVLRARRTSADGLPVLNRADGAGSEDDGWLPLHSIDTQDVRRAGNGIYVVPSANVLRLDAPRIGAPCSAALKARTAPGACLVIGPPGGPFAARCWTLSEIDRGRALALLDQNGRRRLIGFTPAKALLVTSSRTSSRIVADHNVIDRPTKLHAGTRVETKPVG